MFGKKLENPQKHVGCFHMVGICLREVWGTCSDGFLDLFFAGSYISYVCVGIGANQFLVGCIQVFMGFE